MDPGFRRDDEERATWRFSFLSQARQPARPPRPSPASVLALRLLLVGIDAERPVVARLGEEVDHLAGGIVERLLDRLVAGQRRGDLRLDGLRILAEDGEARPRIAEVQALRERLPEFRIVR